MNKPMLLKTFLISFEKVGFAHKAMKKYKNEQNLRGSRTVLMSGMLFCSIEYRDIQSQSQ